MTGPQNVGNTTYVCALDTQRGPGEGYVASPSRHKARSAIRFNVFALVIEFESVSRSLALDRGGPAFEGAPACRQSPPQLKQQTASTIGSVGICSTKAIPVKTKTNSPRLGINAS